MLSRLDGFQVSELGSLDIVTSKQLEGLRALPGLQFTLVALSTDLKSIKQRATKILDVSINVIGPIGLENEIASMLNKQGCYLQHPVCLKMDIRYNNPQYFYPDGI